MKSAEMTRSLGFGGSLLALAGMVAAVAGYCVGWIEQDTMKHLLLLFTVVWFIAASVWMKDE